MNFIQADPKVAPRKLGRDLVEGGKPPEVEGGKNRPWEREAQRGEMMAESAAVDKPPLAEQLLPKVPGCDGADAQSLQKQLPICKLEPICIEEEQKESPTALPPVYSSTHGKNKESPSKSAIYSLGANQCFHCLITFPDEKFMVRHMKREHPEDFVQANLRDALFVCFICSKAFESSRALICHQRGHAPALPTDCLRPTFDCPDCGHRFGQLANYQRHRLGHAAGHSLPHQCPDCGKSFRQLSNLRRHQAFHRQTQELLPSRPYSCMECGESFNQEAGLHEHYIRHARGEL
ncbi:zinc finger protein 576-like isoform X2 [Hemicordylus capensis]|uniref:zinc finger protein 576-like isoform X2 n=1 Tax=Hemicordylus capensis TaxID=884348 RepID=UPI002302ECFC|nr:zinc finger protein 576-like isoform X2 [Hemicordylus capensis]